MPYLTDSEYSKLQEELKNGDNKIAELKNKLNEITTIRNQENQDKDKLIDNLKHENKNLQYRLTKLEDHLKDICPHTGESKQGICLDCGAEVL